MPENSRRRFLQLTAGGIAVAGLGGIATARATDSPAQKDELDENYKGHRIQIKRTAPASPHTEHGAAQIGSTVYIDGVELHVMRLNGGGFVSSVAHYEPLRTLPEAARAAVDNLGSPKLRPFRA